MFIFHTFQKYGLGLPKQNLSIVPLGTTYIGAALIKVPKLTLYVSDQVSDLARASQQGITNFFQVGVLLEVGGSPTNEIPKRMK